MKIIKNKNAKNLLLIFSVLVLILVFYLIYKHTKEPFNDSLKESYFNKKDDSILLFNIYILNNQIFYLSKNQENIPDVTTHHKYNHSFKPKIINNIDKLNYDKNNIITLENCLYTSFLWPFNIGHGLFDELYPGYCALKKFNLHKNFNLLLSDNNLNKEHELYSIIETMSSNKIIHLKDYNNKLIYVKKLCCGVKGMGQFTINREYTMYNKDNSLLDFRNQILEKYNINRIKNLKKKKIKIIIIDNKRFNKNDIIELNKIVEYFNKNNNIDISYIKWQDIKPFSKQMKLMNDVDIQITSLGTAMIYTPFLKEGSVNINLGVLGAQDGSGRKIPFFGEQQLCSATNYVKSFYYPIHTYDIKFNILKDLVYTAIKYYKNNNSKNRIKVIDNLNTDAKIFREYLNQEKDENVEKIIQFMIDNTQWVEYFVAKTELYSNSNLNINFDLLDKIINKYNYKHNYNERIIH